MDRPVLHKTENENFKVFPLGASFFYVPAREHPEAVVFIAASIEYSYSSRGTGTAAFLVKVPSSAEKHYDLIADGKRIGLRPWKNGVSNPTGSVFWPEPFSEPAYWHPDIVVEYVSENIGLGAYPVMKVGYVPSGQKETLLLVEMALTLDSLKLHGDRPSLAPINFSGRNGIKAMIKALQYVLQIIDLWPAEMSSIG